MIHHGPVDVRILAPRREVVAITLANPHYAYPIVVRRSIAAWSREEAVIVRSTLSDFDLRQPWVIGCEGYVRRVGEAYTSDNHLGLPRISMPPPIILVLRPVTPRTEDDGYPGISCFEDWKQVAGGRLMHYPAYLLQADEDRYVYDSTFGLTIRPDRGRIHP